MSMARLHNAVAAAVAVATVVLMASSPRGGEAWTMCGDCWCANGNGSCPTWEPKNYSASFIAAYKAEKPLNPYGIGCNPYTNSSCVTTPPQVMVNNTNAVCGRVYPKGNCSAYHMVTFPSAEAATAAGAVITHERSCGLCSTTQDVGAYMAIPDFTKVGKKCAIEALIDKSWGIKCFEDAGFTTPCAVIWTYDALFDGKNCRDICIKDLFKPYNGPPPFCPINPCLACDEDKAGPVFKHYAGATRRRSGLQSNIARPCSSVAQIDHSLCSA